MAIITNTELMDHLGLDETDNVIDRNLLRAIASTESYLTSAIGEDFDQEDAKAKELALMIASDLYDVRGTSDKANINLRRLYGDLCEQLRVETIRAKEGS